MIKQSFTIEGRLPSLNDLIHAMNAHRHVGAKLKRVTQHYIGAYCSGIKATSHPVTVSIAWYEPNRKRDPDNITSGGTKFILDALVGLGKLPDDSQRIVRSINHTLHVCPAHPRVEVTIEEVDE